MLFLIIEKAIGQIPKEALEASGRCADCDELNLPTGKHISGAYASG